VTEAVTISSVEVTSARKSFRSSRGDGGIGGMGGVSKERALANEEEGEDVEAGVGFIKRTGKRQRVRNAAYERVRPRRSETMKSTRKTTKQTFAIVADVPAIPPKPRIPAINAMIRKVMA
jgi:hypothetical protein